LFLISFVLILPRGWLLVKWFTHITSPNAKIKVEDFSFVNDCFLLNENKKVDRVVEP